MRVEIIKELDSDDATLEIPWASPTEQRLHYVDLKRFPEKIDRLTECKKYPPLVGLLRKVHAAGSAFRTAKCDVWTTTKLSEDERLDFQLPFKVGSYVDLVFNSVKLNSRLRSQLRLGEKLELFLSHCRVQAQLEIAVRRCLFHPKGRWGYYLAIFVHAYGTTRAEAKREWARAVDFLADALWRSSLTFGDKRSRRS